MRVHELVTMLKALPQDHEVFMYNSDADELYAYEAEVLGEVELYRKGERVGFEQERVPGGMNTYALEHYKDAEVFKGVIL